MGRLSLLCLVFAVVASCAFSSSPAGHFQHGLQLTLDPDYIDAVTGGGATFFHNAAKVDLEQPLYTLHDSDDAADEAASAESADGESIDPDCLLTSKEDLDASDLEAAMSLAELQSQHTREQRNELRGTQDAGIGPLTPQTAPAVSKKAADKQLKEVVKAIRSGVSANSDSESVFPPRIVHDQGISLGAQAPVTLNDKNLLGAEFDVDLSSRVASHRAATNGDVGSPTKRLKCPHHLRSRPNAVSPLPIEGESHEAWKQDLSRIIIPAVDMLKPSPEKHEASDEYIGPDGFFRLKAIRPSITAQPDTVDTTMCKFPFTYGKVEHWGCTTFGSSKGRPWCMTRENSREGELPWAFCAEDCLSIARECNAVDNTNTVRKCVFPFVYEGVEYGNCTNVDRDNYWCPFEVNADGSAKEGKWGYCTDCKCADATAVDGEKCKHYSTFEKFKFKNARTYGCNNAGTEGPDNNAEPWCETVSGQKKHCPRLQHCEVHPSTPKHVQASAIANTLPSRISYASCYNIAEGGTDQELFQSVMERRPDLWLWIGDNIYADSLDMGKCGKVERDYKQLKEDPAYQLMTKAKVPMMFIWDDHDFGSNNAGKYFPGKDPAQKQFLDFFDVPPADPRRQRAGVFNSQKFSNGSSAVKVVMVDVRYSRDPSHYFENEPCENTVSMLGEQQWGWLQNEMLGDSADVLFLVSGIQVVPPLVTTSGKHPLCSFLPPHADRNLNAIRELGEEGLTGMNAEGWGEMPSERHRLLRLIQTAVNRGNYKKIVILSGDIHFAEITRMVVPATADLKPVEVLELTSSGIRQNWANVRSDPYRLPVVADTRGNNVFNQGCKIPFRHQGTWYKNCTSVPNPEGVSGKPWCYTQLTPRGKGVKDSWGYCAPAGATVPWGKQGRIGNPSVFARDPYKIQLATSNYGRVEIDWLRQEIALQIIAPHEATAVAGDVAAETIVSFAGSPTLN